MSEPPFDASGAAHQRPPGTLDVRRTRLRRDGHPFFVSGFNYWGATTLARLARDGSSSGWTRVQRDLDALQSLGVNTVRTMAATEGPDGEPWRIAPAIHGSPGRYESAGVGGILRFAEELRRRQVYGIFVLNNFWPWSGGMGQYLAWAGEGPIPYPPPAPGGTWDEYQRFAARFYANERARDTFDAYLQFLVPQLRDNPYVVWELANEPRGRQEVVAFRRWIDETAGLVKSLAPEQLVTTGSEGQTPAPDDAGLDVEADHASPFIDFVTFHVWAQNWGWVRPESLARDYPSALALARDYISDHARRAAALGKPIVLEEFGFPRDDGAFDAGSPTTLRDRYFDCVYELVHSLFDSTPMVGIMPWAWSGDGRPPRPGGYWKPGDPLVGDPPHEPQGWYGVYESDSTVDVVRSWSRHIARANSAHK